MPADLTKRFGKRFRELREAKGLTQEAVGDHAGVAGRYVSEVERGRRDIRLSSAGKLVERGLGESLATIFAPFRRPDPGDQLFGPSAVDHPLPRDVLDFAHQLAGMTRSQRRRVLSAMKSVLRVAKT